MADASSENQGLRFPDEARTPRERWLWAGVMVLLLFVSYAPAIQAGFIWDDPRYVTDRHAQEQLSTLQGLFNIWFRPSTGDPDHYTTPQYYPLTHTTYWIEYHLWGI